MSAQSLDTLVQSLDFSGIGVYDSETFDCAGFKIECKIELDTDPDLSWLGKYSDSPGVNAIKRNPGILEVWDYEYFNPGNGDYGLPRGKNGGVNAEARKYAYQDYRRMERYNAGDWCMYGLVVTASRYGVELGEASLWGVESDCQEHIAETFRELVHEAISAANDKIAEMKAGECGK